MAVSPLSGAAAIVGIGATEFSKKSGRSELQLACEAVTAALADAGIDPSEVDGLTTFTMETSMAPFGNPTATTRAPARTEPMA